MEEILASIRRIIADDDAKPPLPRAPEPPPVAAAPPPPRPVPPPAPPPPPPRPVAVAPPPPPPPEPEPEPEPVMRQDELDAMFAEPPPAEKPDVLELTEAMAAPEPPPPPRQDKFRTIDGQPDVVFEERPPIRDMADRPLMSSSTSSMVDQAFNSLAQTVLVQNARTLEDLVKEMLRPMLKTWLDDNLPGLVERLVRAEIERVSRGRQ
jgi:cell pole-organizing protein PopZ